MTRVLGKDRIGTKALGWTVLLTLAVAFALVALADSAGAVQPDHTTARLGISAGAAIEDAELGLCGQELQQRIPVLFETADRLNVRIETVSVGQGFFADDGALLSEKDLDLVVTGHPDQIAAMAATLGKEFDQSVVFVWLLQPGGAQATASIPLPNGAEALTTEIYEVLITELAGGGHVRYAGDLDLIFVANTGDEPEEAFHARMERVRALLDRAGIATGQVKFERSEFVALDRDSYDEHITGDTAQPALTGAAGRLSLARSKHDACRGTTTS